MASVENNGGRKRPEDAEALLEGGGKSFNGFAELTDLLSGGDASVSGRRINLTVVNNFDDPELRQYSELSDYDVFYVKRGTGNPDQTDLEDLDTDISLAIIDAYTIGHVYQDRSDGEEILVDGKIHYVLPMDEQGKQYLDVIHSK